MNMAENNNNNENIKTGFFSKKLPVFLVGLILVIIGLLAFFNVEGLSSLILYCLAYPFGSFSFLFLSVIILFGIYLMIKMEFPKLKASFTFLGLLLIFISGCICSSLSVEGLTFVNFGDKYNQTFSSLLTSNIHLSNLNDVCKLSGGFIGYFFSSLFVNGLGRIATGIFAGVFLFCGVLICIRKPLMAFYLFVRRCKNEKKARKIQEAKEKEEKEKQEAENKEQTQSTITISPFSTSTNELKVEPAKELKPNKEQPLVENKTSLFKTRKDQEADLTSVITSSELSNQEKKEEVKNQGPYVSPFTGQDDNNFSSSNTLNDNNLNTTTTIDELFTKPVQTTPNQPFSSSNEITQEPVKPVTQSTTTSPFSDGNNYAKSNVSQIKQANQEQTQLSNQNSSISEPIQSLHRTMNIHRYTLPSADLLTTQNDISKYQINVEASEKKKEIIDEVYKKLGIGARVRDYTIGPSVTRFNIIRDEGVKVSEIIKNDVLSELQIDLGGDTSVRMEAVVKGENASGIEIANVAPMMVSYKECFNSVGPSDSKTVISLGKDISNKFIKTSLDDLPHLLVSGTTGSGKSVFIHSIIMTLIMRNYPDELKFILVDPKVVEFAKYKDMPHLYCPIVSNVSQAVATLKKLCVEMDRRFNIFATTGASNLNEYNQIRKEKTNLEIMPRIVTVIDEFADLMQQDSKNVESYTQRLAQKARACGIYLIIATQRPSVNCITGTIKANIPARIALMLPGRMDSMTIIDEGGAEALIGKGDLLAKIPSLKAIIRVQSAFVQNMDILHVVDYLKKQCQPEYDPEFINFNKGEEVTGKLDSHRGLGGLEDELYEECKAYVIQNRVAATSNLQRMFSIGYSRAASILDALEYEGIIKTGPNNRKEVVAPIPNQSSDN